VVVHDRRARRCGPVLGFSFFAPAFGTRPVTGATFRHSFRRDRASNFRRPTPTGYVTRAFRFFTRGSTQYGRPTTGHLVVVHRTAASADGKKNVSRTESASGWQTGSGLLGTWVFRSGPTDLRRLIPHEPGFRRSALTSERADETGVRQRALARCSRTGRVRAPNAVFAYAGRPRRFRRTSANKNAKTYWVDRPCTAL